LANNPDGDVFSIDIVYMATGSVMQKIRITRCGCDDTQPITPTELQPGEQAALEATAERLARAAG
jgi:hypothetical protein